MYMCVIQLFSVEHLQMSQCPICERYINLNADLYHTNIKAHTYIYIYLDVRHQKLYDAHRCTL